MPVKGYEPAAVCGTAAGLLRHRWQGEQPCQPCRAAWLQFAAQPERQATANTESHRTAGHDYDRNTKASTATNKSCDGR
jgi:hypothetical protein